MVMLVTAAPEMDLHNVATWLLQVGGQAGVLYVAIWFLVRALKDGYDSRIGSLEQRSGECEQDRMKLHEQIHTMQTSRIRLLEKLLSEQVPGKAEEDEGAGA